MKYFVELAKKDVAAFLSLLSWTLTIAAIEWIILTGRERFYRNMILFVFFTMLSYFLWRILISKKIYNEIKKDHKKTVKYIKIYSANMAVLAIIITIIYFMTVNGFFDMYEDFGFNDVFPLVTGTVANGYKLFAIYPFVSLIMYLDTLRHNSFSSLYRKYLYIISTYLLVSIIAFFALSVALLSSPFCVVASGL